MKESTREILGRITADDYDPTSSGKEGSDIDNCQQDIVNGVKLWERVRGLSITVFESGSCVFH